MRENRFPGKAFRWNPPVGRGGKNPSVCKYHEGEVNTLPVNTELCVYDDQPVDGYYIVPDRPGIGNELNERALAEAEIFTVSQ